MTTRWSLPAPSIHDAAPGARCPHCGLAMSVRVNLPLWLTMLVGPDDDRQLLVDECDGCGWSRARIAPAQAAPEPPPTDIEAVVAPDRGPPSWCGRGHRLRTPVRLVDRRAASPIETPVRVCLQCEHATLGSVPHADAS